MTGVDVGEMFLNFPLHSDLQTLYGVDVTQYVDNVDEFKQVVWLVWWRAAMGLGPYAPRHTKPLRA
jgi:hypothetical protein